MTIARALRLLLGFAAICTVVWSFYDVGRRAWQQQRERHERPITLTILHWGDKDEAQIVEDLKNKFEATHPNIRIVRIPAPGSSDMTAKFKTMVSAGEPPDLFYLPPDMLAEVADLKLVRPVDDYVAKEIARPGGKQWFDDYFPLLIKAWRFDSKTQLRGKGPLYGLPKDFTTAIFYINCDLFDKAGVDWRDIQKNGWTWDRFEAEMKKIRALSNTPGFEGREIYGGAFEIWHDTIRNFVWTFGGDFFATDPDGHIDFRKTTVDSPQCQEALKMIYRVCREEQTVYFPSGIAKETYQEFFAGNVACDGPIGRWRVPRFKDIKNFRWDVVPIPYKKKEFQASQMYYTAWSMSAGSKHPDEAFELMKFLCGGQGAIQQSRAGLAIPPLQSVAYSKDFLAPEGLPPHNAQVFLDATKYMRLQQSPRESEWRTLLEDQVKRSIQLKQISTADSAKEVQRLWNQVLDAPLRRHEWQPMRWDLVLTTAAALTATLIAVLWWRARRERLGPIDRAIERTGYVFILPWIIGFLALTLGPMLASLILSFTQWGALNPMSEARGVGVANYAQLFSSDPKFYLSLRITGYYVALCVPLTQAAALAVAVLMNLRVRGIAVFRTIFFVPSLIVASVVGAVLWMQMYNNQYGIVNQILRAMHLYAPDWFGTDVGIWGVPGFALMTIWGVGSAMILYLAGLKGIPTSLYEAATIDGAGHAGQFVHVTLPMLSPLIFYNVVMGLIASFQFFVQPMVMTKGGPNDQTLFYVLNLYRQAFEFHNMGYASAMAWILFLLLLGLTVLIFRASKNVVYYEGLKV